MSDPYADQADHASDGTTIPMVPDGGYAEPTVQPFADQTLVDPLGADPWSSGAGLGSGADVTPTEQFSLPTTPIPTNTATQALFPPNPPVTLAAPVASPPSASYLAPPAAAGYPAPAPFSYPAPYHTAFVAGQTATPAFPSQASHPATTSPVPQPASSQPAYQQPPFAQPGSTPYGPSASLPDAPYATYAQSPYGGQQLRPAISDPVAYDYGYGRSVPLSAHPSAAPALVLGILSVTMMSLLGPIAWYLGARARRETEEQPGRWQPSGMATAGIVLGIIGTVVTALVVLFVVVAIIGFASIG